MEEEFRTTDDVLNDMSKAYDILGNLFFELHRMIYGKLKTEVKKQ